MQQDDIPYEFYTSDALRVMRAMDDAMIDALITDPPYASGAADLAGRQQSTARKYTSTKGNCKYPDFAGDAMDQRSWSHFMYEILVEGRRMTRPGGVCVLFIDWRQMPTLSDAMQWAGWTWRGLIAWDKLSSRPQQGRFKQQIELGVWGSNGSMPFKRGVPPLPGVYTHTNVPEQQRRHMTQKPLELMRQIVRICSPGGVILDPFAGSGTTLEAAVLEGYRAIGIETVPAYAQIVEQRMSAIQVPMPGVTEAMRQASLLDDKEGDGI